MAQQTKKASEIARVDLGKKVKFPVGESNIVGVLSSVSHYSGGATHLAVESGIQNITDFDTVVEFI